jgi:hypothetical protein
VSGAARERLAWWGAAVAAGAAVLAYHARAAAPGMAFAGWDLRYFFYATREATAAALRSGELPGWQRGIFLGYPLVADPQAAVLDPATWLTLPWDAPRALTLATLLHLCVAACGMVYWLRLRGCRPPEALLAAVLFALGAKQTVHLQHWTFAASTAWWPWMLAGLEGFSERGAGRFLLLTAAASGLAWLGGSPQMAYFGTLVAGAYALVLAPRLWRRRPLDAALALVAAPLGLALAGPIVLPIVELAGLGPRGSGVDYRFVTSWKWPDRWALALFVLPGAYGGGARWTGEMNLWEATGYLGILPLGLAAAAPLRRRGAWLFALLAIAGVWLSFGEDAWLGVHRLLYRALPGYASFRNPTRSLMVTSFASALLAAEALRALREGEGRRGWRCAAVLGAVALAAPLLWRSPSFPLDREAARAGSATAVALAAAGLAWLAARRPLASRAGAAWALVPAALAFADLHLAFGGMNEVTPASWQAPALAELAPHVPAAPAPRRVAVLASWGATSNAPLRRGWEGTAGYGPTSLERVRLLLEATRDDRLEPPSPITSDIDFPRPDPTSRLWPLLATPLVVSDDPLPLPVVAPLRAEYDLPEKEHPTAAYRAPALPRVFWTGAWEVVADERIAAPLIAAARGDRALLAPGAAVARFPASQGASGPVAAREVRVEGGWLEAVLTAPEAGVAVVLEPWFPGWSATLDGAPAPLARADYAFMAVPVPAGTHHLRLEYRNAQVGRGAAVAALAMAALLAVLYLRRRRASAAPSPHPLPRLARGGEGGPGASSDSDRA